VWRRGTGARSLSHHPGVTKPTLRLTYFDGPGRAEPVRLVLTLAGVPFEDHRLKFPDFMAQKAAGAFPLGSLPVREVDGAPIVQTAAMLRYAARLADTGLYPSDPFEALVVDSALDTCNDTLSNALVPSLTERDPEKKLALRAAFAEGPMRLCYAYLEDILARRGGPFVLGEALSIADLVIGFHTRMVRAGRLDGVPPETLDAWPHLARHLDAFVAEPRVAAWLSR
jgi:glutathione S-transferase